MLSARFDICFLLGSKTPSNPKSCPIEHSRLKNMVSCVDITSICSVLLFASISIDLLKFLDLYASV